MALTQQEADAIEEKFLDAFDATEGVALKAKEAWDNLYALMEREDTFSDKLGVDTIDWQIGNWANDVTMELHNAGRFAEAIEVNKNILNIHWGRSNDLFHENALRDIADEYAYMGIWISVLNCTKSIWGRILFGDGSDITGSLMSMTMKDSRRFWMTYTNV